MRMLAGGLIAGFAAGLFATVLHFAFVQDIILHAELYESGELVHFGEPMGHGEEAGHDDHGGHGGASEGSAFTRNLLTVLFTGLIYAGYGLVLVAGYQVAGLFGRTITPQEGVLWGIAGFAAFQLSPAMGLAPELPGAIGADITLRQYWWLGTVVATAGGLALIGYGRGVLTVIAGATLVALPHAIGAPVLDEFYGYAPPELAAEFSARVLGVALAVWALLGWLTARFAAPDPDAA
ncbi:CbtA family protein [Nioella sediminis]|uniref:CbtA family protein n=1 Tax=Nioella sediminis TaxID=1912092 RepID=UPI001FEB61AD|nr:CbtA family protein [Nioella sediminis]